MHFSASRLALCLPFLLLLGADHNQDGVRRTPGDKLVLQAGSHQAADLVAMTAKFLGRNYLLDPSELQGVTEITLQNRLELEQADCEAVVSQLLYSIGLGFKTVNRTYGVYDVIRLQGPRRADLMSSCQHVDADSLLQMPAAKIGVATTLELVNLRATSAANMLRMFFQQGNQSGLPVLTAGSLGSERVLMLSGFADEVITAIRLAREADAKAKEELTAPLQERLERIEARISALEKR